MNNKFFDFYECNTDNIAEITGYTNALARSMYWQSGELPELIQIHNHLNECSRCHTKYQKLTSHQSPQLTEENLRRLALNRQFIDILSRN